MNLKRSPFSILDKDKREMDYIKGVYKRKIQAEDGIRDTLRSRGLGDVYKRQNKYVRFEVLPYTDKGSTIEFEYG